MAQAITVKKILINLMYSYGTHKLTYENIEMFYKYLDSILKEKEKLKKLYNIRTHISEKELQLFVKDHSDLFGRSTDSCIELNSDIDLGVIIKDNKISATLKSIIDTYTGTIEDTKKNNENIDIDKIYHNVKTLGEELKEFKEWEYQEELGFTKEEFEEVKSTNIEMTRKYYIKRLDELADACMILRDNA